MREKQKKRTISLSNFLVKDLYDKKLNNKRAIW